MQIQRMAATVVLTVKNKITHTANIVVSAMIDMQCIFCSVQQLTQAMISNHFLSEREFIWTSSRIGVVDRRLKVSFRVNFPLLMALSLPTPIISSI